MGVLRGIKDGTGAVTTPAEGPGPAEPPLEEGLEPGETGPDDQSPGPETAEDKTSEGLPVDAVDTRKGPGEEVGSEEYEKKILKILAGMDQTQRGVPYQNLLEEALGNGMSKMAVEETVNILIDKGMIYEPTLGYIKVV